jgi:hypothetical protein
MFGTPVLGGSTFFSIVMTCGLHYYEGMVMGLAVQAIMGPFHLWENVWHIGITRIAYI